MLKRALDDWRDGIRPGSPAEVRLLRIIRQRGYPNAAKQVHIRDRNGRSVARADLGWPKHRIGIEYDSVEWHGDVAWAHDEARHRAVEDLGWTLLRADKADLRPGERAFWDQLARAWTARSD